MDCPKCQSSQKKKNGLRRGKQSFKCKECGYQYVENPTSRAYPLSIKQLCLKMYKECYLSNVSDLQYGDRIIVLFSILIGEQIPEFFPYC